MKQKLQFHMGVGTISLLMIFVVLCMVILSTLSYLSAKGSLDLANREKEEVISYYTADASAVLLVQGFHAQDSLTTNYHQMKNSPVVKQQHIEIILENTSITLNIPMENNKQLQVCIQEDGTILSWGVVHEKGEKL